MLEQISWEEQFDKRFPATVHHVGKGNYIVLDEYHVSQKNIKDFIASQIEKTRREAHKEMFDKYPPDVKAFYALREDEGSFDDGFKAGLQRALELIPTLPDGEIDYAAIAIKKELEKSK